MKRETIHALAAINRAFYTDPESAQAFDSTRSTSWAGWERLLPFFLPAQGNKMPRILDIGCGNGRFARFLADRMQLQFQYLGLDTSEPLLETAHSILPPPGCHFEWKTWDFLDHTFPPTVEDGSFHLVTFFGVMHHVPSFPLRQSLLQRASALLTPDGLLALAFWRFGEEPRFKRRILPWETLTRLRLPGVPTIDREELEPGDYLLAWGEETGRPRYCHAVDSKEEEKLLSELDLERVTDYFADGREKRLNHYQLLRRPANAHVPEPMPNA